MLCVCIIYVRGTIRYDIPPCNGGVFFLPDTWGPWPWSQSPANSSSASLAGRLGTALLRSEFASLIFIIISEIGVWEKLLVCFYMGIETFGNSYEVNHFVP